MSWSPLRLAALLAMGAAAGAMAQEAAPSRSTAGQVRDSAGRIVTQPLRDLNVVRDTIPPELASVMAEPYSLAGVRTCADYKAEIGRLTAVLGPDVNSAQAAAASGTPADYALGAAESVAGSLVPGMGIVRRVSGADAAQRQAQAAVLAGQLRRAFLTGRASGRGCRI